MPARTARFWGPAPQTGGLRQMSRLMGVLAVTARGEFLIAHQANRSLPIHRRALAGVEMTGDMWDAKA
jgi:hypothetical protein